VYTTPATHQAPAGAKTSQQTKDAPGFHSQRLCIALRTANPVRQNPQEDDSRRDTSQHKEAAEYENEKHGV
jgi:hypothetical protein